MSVVCKKYTLADYDRVSRFFRELYLTSKNVPYWLPQRFEYAEYLVSPLNKDRGTLIDWKETIYLWEVDNSQIVGFLCSEDPDENIFISTLRDFNYLEKEMIEKGENIVRNLLQKQTIKIWCEEYNQLRQSFLLDKGYKKDAEVEYLNWKDLEEQIPVFEMPKGYVIHDMTDETGLDLQHKIDRLTGAFDSKTYPLEIYRIMQKGPSYQKNFDLYTTDSEGNVTSFCIVWYDKELNIGYFEPVATDANHRKKGLGRATLNIGLQRLKKKGAERAFVGSSGDLRKAFYNASGFTQRITIHPWVKELIPR